MLPQFESTQLGGSFFFFFFFYEASGQICFLRVFSDSVHIPYFFNYKTEFFLPK